MMAVEKRYSVNFAIREKALKVLKEKAYKRGLSIAAFVRIILAEKGVIPKEE